jgi:putative 4-mercaptohistidine N1-methyltranferase
MSDELLAQYCEFHYGREYFGVDNFPKKCAESVLSLSGRQTRRALDLGCAVGRSSFELARIYKHVDALDYSARFIDTAKEIQRAGQLTFPIKEEGDISFDQKITLAEHGLNKLKGSLTFHQGDACNLSNEFKEYDLVTAFNLLCRLPEPRKFLEGIHGIINTGGIFVITTPCTWMEEFTEKSKWMGGYYKNGVAVNTFEGIKAVLSNNFRLLDEPQEIEFVIRETKRKYQHSFSQFSVWEKKS